METTRSYQANDLSQHLERQAHDYAWNVAASGLLSGASLGNVALATSLLQQAGEPAAEIAKLPDRELVARLHAHARACRARPRPVGADDPRTAANLALVGQALGLGPVEMDVIRLLIAAAGNWDLTGLLNTIRCRSLAVAMRILAAAIGRDLPDVEAALAPTSRVVAGGFVMPDPHCNDFDDAFTVDSRLYQLASEPGLTAHGVLDRFLPRAPDAALGLDDYPQAAEAVRLGARLITAALDSRARGVNVLIHGATGAGKSELARVLAREARALLYVAGKEDHQGLPPECRERLGALQLGHRVLSGARAVIAFDELEDLFVRDNWSRVAMAQGRDAARMSKLWFNNLLEQAPVPTIWLSNDVCAMDPAFLRRFTLAIELRWPSQSQRKRLWQKHLGDDLRLPPADIDHLAARFAVSPGQIETAARSARMLGADGDARRVLEGIIAPVAALVDARKQAPSRLPAGGYDPRLAESRVDLGALADRLAAFREGEGPGVSLCLYGPPGTGKSEYVRYLAARLERPLVLRRCSDLLSMWVGGTEKQLAEAFREAREERAVLLLDEADSFLRDRRRVTQGWEVTQVNELLQQLEAFEGIVACTTNLFDDLDKAALRRFTFRIAFGALPPLKARALFVRLLAELAVDASAGERQAAEAALARLANLTPGYFAVVARRLRALRPPSGLDALAIVRELEEEVAVKDGAARRAGFGFG